VRALTLEFQVQDTLFGDRKPSKQEILYVEDWSEENIVVHFVEDSRVNMNYLKFWRGAIWTQFAWQRFNWIHSLISCKKEQV